MSKGKIKLSNGKKMLVKKVLLKAELKVLQKVELRAELRVL